jgi:hypothetical protein
LSDYREAQINLSEAEEMAFWIDAYSPGDDEWIAYIYLDNFTEQQLVVLKSV